MGIAFIKCLLGNWISTIEIQVQNQNPYSFLLQQNKELQNAEIEPTDLMAQAEAEALSINPPQES
jgi:hypothetical protein